MSAFSAYLQSLFQETGLSVYAMSKACGVERTFLHKILNGTRLPSCEAVVEKIADTLRLGEEQSKLLYRQYQICRDGGEAYERRSAVNALLTGMILPTHKNTFDVLRRVDVQSIPPVATDRVTTLRLIKLLLDVEMAEPQGLVQLFCGTEEAFLWHLLTMYVDNRPDLPVRQIICLQNGGTHQALLHNLDLLRHTLPLALSGADYQTLVCYGEHVQTTLLPNLLLTSRYALQFSDDFTYAILAEGAQQLELFGALLARRMRSCHPLVRRLKHPLDLLEHYRLVSQPLPGVGEALTKLYTLGSEPCVAPFYTQKLLDDHLCPTLQSPEFKKRILDYSAQCKHMLERCQVTHYFTAQGVHNFMRTGRLTALPADFYAPLSPAARHFLLEQQVSHAAAYPNYAPLALDTEQLHLPENLTLETAANGALSFIYAHPDAGFLALALDDPLLCNAFYDYLERLQQSRYSLSRSDSLALLRSAQM